MTSLIEKIFKGRNKDVYYFISYAYTSGKQAGHGSIELSLNNSIQDYSAIKSITKYLNGTIKDTYGNPCQCIVLNWRKMKKGMSK